MKAFKEEISMIVNKKEKNIQYCDLKEGEYFLNKGSDGVFTLCRKLDEVDAAVIKEDFTDMSNGELLDAFDEIIPIEECYFYPFSDFRYSGCNNNSGWTTLPWVAVNKEDLNPGDMFLYDESLFMLLNTEDKFNCLPLCQCALDDDTIYSIGNKESVLKLKSVHIEVEI